MTQQERLRKYQDELGVFGLGVMAFGLWSFFRTLLYMFNMPVDDIISEMGISRFLFWLLVAAITVILLLPDLALRFVIWRSCRAESRGTKKKGIFIGITIFLLIISAASIVLSVVTLNNEKLLQFITTLVFEGSSVFIMMRLLIAAFGIRRLRKEDNCDTGTGLAGEAHNKEV